MSTRLPKNSKRGWHVQKATPLYINLQVDPDRWAPSPKLLLSLLLKHTHRWGRLRFLSDYPQRMGNFLKGVAGNDAPLLERLSLGIQGDSWHPWKNLVAEIFNGPDSLSELVEVELSGVWW
ncbi:hypothetical protein M407DRAFT_186798 [Tulasnella calospora MUT 4182]|uniref:Uncharacterized protein n=1 Tax=Tulasnella calospora MUT 4182 TaxID=1051891 RepID=A0A0C3QVK7_9AGAM|nr:hypothetical protein M407DRAFT_186798 [Tulasnella calospora MUT 4182]